ncbi:unnamed protein product, partial [Darwinula stevensoni]
MCNTKGDSTDSDIIASGRSLMRVLNVAEKNDAARTIAELLSQGSYRRREGLSKFNKIYEFQYNLLGQQCQMVMTSVSGHLLNLEFIGAYRKWGACDPLALFDAPVAKACGEDYMPIKKTLEREVRQANVLVVWTDCDREGENIGYEIIEVCKAVKPNLRVYRAKFSEITAQSVQRACRSLEDPDKRVSDAVDVRQELDLRIGAAFTRFQTLRLQGVFPAVLGEKLISYGSCQFPTLGFVVERYKAIQSFIPESFWKLKVVHNYQEKMVEFVWKRGRLFDQLACQVLHDVCSENPQATVVDVKTKPKNKWRPLPLDTVELEKLASRKLRINAKETMRIAERLYTKGYISYPRTETNIFPKELNLVPLVQMQMQDPQWGGFAQRVLDGGPNPRQGKKSDKAHPPIHPTKYAPNLDGNERRIYEFIVRHFLACLSQDALGQETTVEIVVADERFTAHGLVILARNYLDVYPYETWSGKELPLYETGQQFLPTSIDMVDGETSPPPLLTEADLIALMEKHGIGTDATHAEHIETIKSRLYVGLQGDKRFVPGELGMGLVDGYDSMGFQMSKPHLRAELEADLKLICEGRKDPKEVLASQVHKYKQVFIEAIRQAQKLDEALAHFFGEAQQVEANIGTMGYEAPVSIMKCPKCNMGDIIIRQARNDEGKVYLSCMSYPDCRAAVWFPREVVEVKTVQETCPVCAGNPKLLQFRFKPGSFAPLYPDEYIACVGGCDRSFLDALNISPLSAMPSGPRQDGNLTQRSIDSGYGSTRTSHHTQDATSSSSFSVPSNPPLRRGNNASMRQDGDFARRTPSTSRNVRPAAQNDTGHANSVVCHCNEDALLLTVRKEGPNKGRQFYKCAKPQGSGCNFFLWADEATGVQSPGFPPDPGDDGWLYKRRVPTKGGNFILAPSPGKSNVVSSNGLMRHLSHLEAGEEAEEEAEEVVVEVEVEVGVRVGVGVGVERESVELVVNLDTQREPAHQPRKMEIHGDHWIPGMYLMAIHFLPCWVIPSLPFVYHRNKFRPINLKSFE